MIAKLSKHVQKGFMSFFENNLPLDKACCNHSILLSNQPLLAAVIAIFTLSFSVNL